MQGVANLLSPLICWMFIAICGSNYNLVWRLSFTMGAVPAVAIIICCYWVIETKKPHKVQTKLDSDTTATDTTNTTVTTTGRKESEAVYIYIIIIIYFIFIED